MSNDGRASFELTGDPVAFQRAVTQALHSLDGLKHGVEGVSGVLGRFSAGFAGLAGILGVGALAGLVESALAAGDAIQKMSLRVGIGTTALQELQHAAKLSGLETEGLETGLKFLNKALGEAAAGTPAAVDLFQDLGVEVRDANGSVRNAADAIEDIAEKIKNTASPAEQTRLALAAFGRSGTQLLPMLKEGRAGLAALREEAHRLGVVFDADMVAAAARTKDELERLGAVVKANLTAAILGMAPAIEAAARGLVELAPRVRAVIDALAPVRFNSIESLQKQIADLDKQIAAVQASMAGRNVLQLLLGTNHEAQLATLTKMRLELAGILAAKLPVPASAPPTLVGPSAEQLKALADFQARFAAAVAPSDIQRQIVQFHAEAMKLAQNLPPELAKGVQAMDDAFRTWKTSIDETAKSLDAISKGASAATALGLDSTNVFQGLQDIKALQESLAQMRTSIAALSEQGVSPSAIFETIGKVSQGAANEVAKLTEKYKDQPAILQQIDTLERQLGQDGGGLRRELDSLARGMTGATQGTAQFVDTAEGINTIWTPALRAGGVEVSRFMTAIQSVPTALDAVDGSLVRATNGANLLAQALLRLRLEATAVNAAMAAGAATAPGNF